MIKPGMLQSVWQFRGFIIGSVKREFQLRYRNSMLGAVWTVLQPLAMIVIYTVIFTNIMQAKMPGVASDFGYSIYLCAGIITWGLFVEITGRGQNIFLEQANLIKKLNFPRMCLPLIIIGSASLNFLIIFSLFLVFLVISGDFPGIAILAVLPLLVIQVLFAIGLAVIVGTLNVFFRDVGQFFTLLLQFWFWFTPIVYPRSILPENIKPLLILNPMASLVTGYQDIFVLHQWPQWLDILPVGILSIVLCWFGLRLFRKRAGEMVDEL
jgi:lipopolysaccharide transport system permease protein